MGIFDRNPATGGLISPISPQGNGGVEGGGGGGSALIVQDEGSTLSAAVTKINFAGSGVTATQPVANEILITIPGGAPSFPLLASLGSASAPSYSFTGDTGTGMYSAGASSLNFATAGTNRISLSANSLTVSSAQILSANGSAALPAHSFSSDAGLGLYRVASSQLGVSVGGTNLYTFKAADFGPTTNGTLNCGTASLPWQVVNSTVFRAIGASGSGQFSVMNSGGTEYLHLKGGIISPSGVVGSSVLSDRPGMTGFIGIISESGTASNSIALESGNASAGNSGNITLRTGTATGTRGSITLNALQTNISTSLIPTTNAVSSSLGTASLRFLDAYFQYLRDNTGVIALTASLRELNDSTGAATVSWDGRLLKDAGGVASVDWGTYLLADSGNNVAVDWENRQLFDNTGTLSLEWANAGTITTSVSIVPNAAITLDLGASGLEFASIYVDSIYGSGNCGAKIFDVLNATALDSSGVIAVEFGGRKLKGPANETIVSWGTTDILDILCPQIRVTGTITAGGTTGAQTISKMSGTVNFAAAATSLVVTNSGVTTNSIIIATVQTNDTTMKSVIAVPAAGSFTLHANAAATAETSVAFIVLSVI